jgi:DNA-binding response OmpR family regulator
MILIVGDVYLQKTLGDWFRSKGYSIKSSADGRQGLELFRRTTPNAVILDLTLPGMSGLEVCKSMKQCSPDVPVLVLSTTSKVSDKVLLLELGADDYIVKPFDPRELLARMKAALRRSERARLSQNNRPTSNN